MKRLTVKRVIMNAITIKKRVRGVTIMNSPLRLWQHFPWRLEQAISLSPPVCRTRILALFAFALLSAVNARAEVLSVDLDAFMALNAAGDTVEKRGTDDATHPINRYDLFCQDHAAAAPSQNFQPLIPELLSSYAKTGVPEADPASTLSPANAVSPGDDYKCVGREVLKQLYQKLQDAEAIYSVREHLSSTATRLTWTTKGKLKFVFTGSKTDHSIDFTSVDDAEAKCTGLNGTFDPATTTCSGSKFTASTFNVEADIWPLPFEAVAGSSNKTLSASIFDPVLGTARAVLLDTLFELEWDLKRQGYRRLMIRSSSSDPFTTYYHCDSTKKRKPGSDDYGCGEKQQRLLDADKVPYMRTATPLIAARTGDNSVLKLHVLQTGPGNCVVLECPGNNDAVLLDCGNDSKSSALNGFLGVPANISEDKDTERVRDASGGNKSKSYAHAKNLLEGKTNITAIVSHGDLDHKNLLNLLFFKSGSTLHSKINKFYFGGHYQNAALGDTNRLFFAGLHNHFADTTGKYSTTVVDGTTIKTLTDFYASSSNNRDSPYTFRRDSNTVKTTPLSTGPTQACGAGIEDAQVNIVAANEYGREVSDGRTPDPGYKWTAKKNDPLWPHVTNGNSIIVEIVYKGIRIVIPGDAESGALNWAVNVDNLDKIGDQADILLASHHGADGHGTISNSNITQKWVDYLDPAYLVYTHGNKHTHPKLTTFGNAAADITDPVTTKANKPDAPAYFRVFSRLHDQSRITGAVTRQIRFNNGGSKSRGTVYKVKSNVYSTMAQGSITFSINSSGAISVNCIGPTVTPWEVSAGLRTPGYCKPSGV